MGVYLVSIAPEYFTDVLCTPAARDSTSIASLIRHGWRRIGALSISNEKGVAPEMPRF